VCQRLLGVLLNRLGEADRIDWSRVPLRIRRASRPKRGPKTGPNPPDKGKSGTKRHLLVVDEEGIPLSVTTSAANVHDSSMLFEELLDAIKPIKRPCGRPRKRPKKLHADKAYDDDEKCARALKKRGIKRRIARKKVESSEKLGRHRWVVERTLLAWVERSTGG
jgi:Transposase DDE domain